MSKAKHLLALIIVLLNSCKCSPYYDLWMYQCHVERNTIPSRIPHCYTMRFFTEHALSSSRRVQNDMAWIVGLLTIILSGRAAEDEKFP